MKIGIDTFGCEHSKSGNGSYLINFIKNITDASDVEFELFGSEQDRYTYKSSVDVSYSSVEIEDNLKAEQKWHKSKIIKFLKKKAYDVVVFPAADKILCGKKLKNQKAIAVVNSVLSSSGKALGHKIYHRILKGLHYIDAVIAASEYIRNDLIKLGVDEKKIQVVYNGIDHKLFFPTLDLDSEFVEVNPFSIKRPYFIYGSKLSGPDKKHIELIKAFELFKKITGASHRLVISGTDEEYAKKIHEVVYHSEYASDIFLTGFFPHESFSKLYAGANACIFPAINEGVGLPILEAMACGIPVLCSDSGALKEVGGDAPVYFNPDAIPEVADCMQKIIKDEALVNEKISLGLKRSQDFSWDKTVNETIEIAKKL